MGLIRDDLRGKLQKAGSRLAAQPHGGGHKFEQLSPTGYASGSGGGSFQDQAPYRNPVWKPAKSSLVGRGDAMLRRGDPALYFNPAHHGLFAQTQGPEAHRMQQALTAYWLSQAEQPELRPISHKERAREDAAGLGKKADVGAIIAAQAPTQPQLAGLAGGSISHPVSLINKSWPVRFAQQGAMEAQNALPGAMYAAQAGIKELKRTHNPGLAAGAVLAPIASGAADQYRAIEQHPIRQLNKNPFDTVTALMPLFSGAARAAEGLSAAKTALATSEAPGALGPVREAAGALTQSRRNDLRFIASPNAGAAQALTSGSAAGRLMARLHDKALGISAPWAGDVLTSNKQRLNQLYREAGLHAPGDADLADFFDNAPQGTPPEAMPRHEVAAALLEHHAANHQLSPLGKVAHDYTDFRVGSEARQNEAGFRAIQSVMAEKAAAEEGKTLERPSSTPGHIARTMDVINAGGRLGQLYLKPSYLWANLLGQGVLTGAQQGLRAPMSAARAAALHHAMKGTAGGQETLSIIHRALSGGADRGGITGSTIANDSLQGLTKPEKLIIGAEKGVAAAYGKVLDDPWRFNAFAHEAAQAGYSTPQALYTLTHDPTKLPEFTQIQRRANRAMIDYSRMGKNERDVVRRAVYFYPWVKGATMYGAQFLTEHPNLAAISAELGREGTATTQQRLGDNEIPSFMQGMFISGHRNVPGLGKQPKGRNLAAASIFGTPAGVAQAVFGGGGLGAVGQTASDYPSPALTFALRAGLHYDPQTGRKISEPTDLPSSIAEGLSGVAQSAFPYRLLSDLPKKASRIDKTDLLFPISKGDIAGFTKDKSFVKGLEDSFGSYAFAGPASSRPINEYARRSNYRAEVTGGLADKGKRDSLSIGQWLPEDLVRETNKLRAKHGMPELSAHQQLELHQAVQQKLELKLILDKYHPPGGGKQKPVDRLAALIEYSAKRQGKPVTAAQEHVIKRLRDPDLPASVRNGTIPKLVTALENALFPQRNLPNKIGKPLKAAGARVTIPK